MYLFFTGDELGHIKRITCSQRQEDGEWTNEERIGYIPTRSAEANGAENIKPQSIQKLAATTVSNKTMVRIHYLICSIVSLYYNLKA